MAEWGLFMYDSDVHYIHLECLTMSQDWQNGRIRMASGMADRQSGLVECLLTLEMAESQPCTGEVQNVHSHVKYVHYVVSGMLGSSNTILTVLEPSLALV